MKREKKKKNIAVTKRFPSPRVLDGLIIYIDDDVYIYREREREIYIVVII
jgi:hypothetical protein